MHIHQPHFVQVVSVSANGRNASVPAYVIPTEPTLSVYNQEYMVTNAAVENWDFSYDLGDTALVGEIQTPQSDGIVFTSRKDYPMLTWANYQDEYLDKMIRLEGRGYAAIYSKPSLFCQTCIVKWHAVLPMHWIQEWNGTFFEQRSLSSLGLVMQLGHLVGYSCSNPSRAHKDFVVIDTTGIHNVTVNFCLCDGRLEKRQQLMRVCWWPATARDPQTCATFAVSLELLSNNDGLHPVSDRRQAFCHIIRQYRTLSMMKQAGRGHDPTGVKGTAQGELALKCRACPQDGMNLPDGWDTINWDTMPKDLCYKYFQFDAQDANFHMVNRNVSSAAKDPILNDGCGYFIHNGQYTEHLCAHVSKEEISSCSGFQAMFLANKRVKGLRTTGVAGVTCARHNMWRPNGIGPLQFGERFCNVDFIVFSALLNTILFYLILSYDIACQYGKNFWSQMEALPQYMHLSIDRARVWFKVPNFHLPPHQPACHSAYSFHYMWGAGRTHAETVEQNREFLNGAAASTKMMALGSWWLGVTFLRRRMAENVKEGQVHRDAFEAFDAALRENAPELVESWKNWVHEWEARQHTDRAESPFELKEKVMTMRGIRLKLEKEELLRSGEGVEVEREDTPGTFILMGLDIEETQQQLTIDVKAVSNPTESQTLQRTYMPNLRRFLTATQRAIWDAETERNAESVRLFMPSDILDNEKRVRACAVGLPEVESELRIGEAHEALNALRLGLRTRTMTNRFWLRHCTGQRMLTQGQGVLCQVNLKIHKAKFRYRYVRNALIRLKGHGPWERELRVLEDSDVRALNERALTAEEHRRGGGIAAFGVVAIGEGRRTLSWIWYSARPEEPTEAELVEALRVEWCKAYARTRRWDEDVVLVEEEMRRTIEYGHSMARKWKQRAGARAGTIEPELLEGLMAYAHEQEVRETATSAMLTANPGVEVVVLLDDEVGEGQGDEEDGPPDYEDEGDDELLE
ncbi:CxC2 domain-containing protein [Mycena venus]|uniref:CxC2 domain-containing protein n=1 Tax=Mycena venus TaxID=2733690 RepID=A0A8H6Z3N2_9AGAR|nr:CxC2 domain-containing protein [Mycena venus]